MYLRALHHCQRRGPHSLLARRWELAGETGGHTGRVPRAVDRTADLSLPCGWGIGLARRWTGGFGPGAWPEPQLTCTLGWLKIQLACQAHA